MMIIKKIILNTFLLLLFNNCTGLFMSKEERHFTSEINLNDFKLNQTLSQDMVNFIQSYYPPTQTTFSFHLDATTYKQGKEIENTLRNAGYGISHNRKQEAIPFAYKIDFIDKNLLRTTYNIGSSTLSRLYRIHGTETTPNSPFTIRGLKKRTYREEITTSEYSNYKRAVVIAPQLNVRNQPTSKGKIVGTYKKGSTLLVETATINKKGVAWSKVIEENNENRARYIYSKYIKYLD